MRTELDHLVVAARTLAEGARWVHAQLGVEPQPGGKHEAMGTHNALLRLGARVYLEVIAIDPEAPTPPQPRWFALDDAVMQARLARSPALLAWVARCDELEAAVARMPAFGRVHPMARGAFRWQIAVPDDGALRLDGAQPLLIAWGEPEDESEGEVRHPCDVLEDRGCALQRLRIARPDGDAAESGLLTLLRGLRLTGPVDLEPGAARLTADIRAPRGVVQLG